MATNAIESLMQDGLIELIASGGGAALGGAAIAAVHKRFDVDPEFAGIGAAAIGMFAASQTTGLLRHASIGLAAAGISTVFVEVINQWDPHWLRNPDAKPAHPEPRQAYAETKGAIDQLNAAIQKIAEQQEAQAAQTAALVEQIRAAAAAQAAVADDALTEEELEHLRAITEQLTEPERSHMIRVELEGNPASVRSLRRMLLQMPVDEAVGYLRANLLPRPPRPRNGA